MALSGEVYEQPLHEQPIFRRFANAPLPISEDICARHICLPVFASMTEGQAHQVINALKSALA